ncbi:MAG TPA: DEAD/DEAH box helicase, partial [Myxococcota bacterium]|nr:DEAD/DEAH box helicase [Myxococcota bacterium]
MTSPIYSPGSLIHARGREWIVLSGGDPQILKVRPVTGSEEDQTLLHVDLEVEPVREARFAPPSPQQRGGHEAALLLRDAMLLSLRRGAGPFRSFGQIAVEPRAYQLVPLLMALKQDPVRLLIADDVGVGKTIEAALIARELLDRGDIERLAVLCPPHLVEQWVHELEDRFHIRAAAVTSASAARLERNLPPSESIFKAFPYSVVSLDYIKSERRRNDFLRACPEFVIVDEAHTCSATTAGKHQRYELLRQLADTPDRHLLFLTATPHSGDDAAFYRLLGLLDPA